MNIEKIPNSQHKKTTKKYPTQLAWIILASVLAVLWYNQMSDKPKPPSSFPLEYQGVEVVVRTKRSDWEKYIIELLKVLGDNNSEQERSIRTSFFLALIEHESDDWKYNATSKTGARWLGQITEIVFQDMITKWRANLFQTRFRNLATKNPELLHQLPRDVRTTLQDYLQDATDEKWLIFVSRLKFYAHGAKTADPHANLILSSVFYDLIYDTEINKEKAQDIYRNIREKTNGTPYALPRWLNYGPILQRNIAAAYRYNGSVAIIDERLWITERERYPSKVLDIFLENMRNEK